MRVLRQVLAIAALSLALGAGLAHAGGPGVTLFSKDAIQPVTLSGEQIAAAADVAPTRYTVRASPGGAGTKVTLSGLSVRGLLALAGIDPDTIKFISVVRANGSLLALTRADLADPPPFPEGPALVTDEGATTRFFRPVRDLKGTNAQDNILTSDAGPLEVSVDGGALLAVKASANRTKARTGDTIAFSARVRFPPPGAQLTYTWEFGDGTSATGRQVTHAYTVPGDQQAQVAVRGSGGSGCATFCGGVAVVDVRVGEPPPQQPAPTDTTGGTGTGNPQAPGSSGGGPASGRGGSGGGAGTGSASSPPAKPRPRKPKPKPKPPPVRTPNPGERRTFAGPRITGVLLTGTPALTGKLPSPAASTSQAGGDRKGVQATRGGDSDRGQLGGGLALALGAVSLGALSERRRVRLRVA